MTESSTYQEWKLANPAREFSWFDYAHCVIRDLKIASDVITAISRLIWPDFVEVGGLVFLADQYSEERVTSLRVQGVVECELEFWMNLFSVDGFFLGLESATKEAQEQLAQKLVAAWKCKLINDFPKKAFDVEIVRDDETDDICVVFRQNNYHGKV